MALVAALYDIHGNVPALHAVLADVERLDPDVIVVGGDTVWGPWPQETMDSLRGLDRDVRWIMGNADRDVFDRSKDNYEATNVWCADRLSDDHLSFLRMLPATISIDGVLYCHGSPRSDLDPMTAGTPGERILAWCDGVVERTVVCGHTHAQFDRTVDQFRIVNPGSIGNPFGDAGAYWATFDPEPSLRATAYDRQATAADVRRSGFPHAPMMAPELENPSGPELASALFD